MSSTGIRIETIKEVNDKGEQGYRITKIRALPAKDLPNLYYEEERPVVVLGVGWLNPDNRLYLQIGKKSVCIQGYKYIWPHFYTIENMEKINAHIKAAGQHLADVNRELAEKRKTWAGPVTFVDGVSVEKKVFDPAKESRSVLERIPRLWAEGRLYFMDDNGVVQPFPRPEIEEIEK